MTLSRIVSDWEWIIIEYMFNANKGITILKNARSQACDPKKKA